MAIMWPRSLPRWVLQDPRRSAECKVYDKLEKLLDDTWSVYYSRPWWGISPKGGEIDGEADFIVAHPDKGLLFLEVKGGLVSHDPKTLKWTSKDRIGVVHVIKDPVLQAMKSKHELFKKFRTQATWPKYRVRLRHGVILPDSDPLGSENIGGHEQDLFCFSTDFRDRCGDWIAARLATHSQDGQDSEAGPGDDGIFALDQIIASPAKLVVPLHRELEADVAQQDALLTGAQLQAIAFIDSLPRVVVEGGAGTGKTVIACELAARYAASGKSTLLACLSEALAAALRRRIDPGTNPAIMTLSEMRASASKGTLGRFDAVVIDEGQDVDWNDWDIVEAALSKGGLLRVLFDNNQAVYRARSDIETRLQAKGIPLGLNLRNTKRIAAVTEPLYRGPLIMCSGPDGRPPVLLDTSSTDAPSRLLTTIDELIVGHSLHPEDIAVLVPDSKAAAAIKALFSSEKVKVTDALTMAPGAVVVETISGFKGLEALAIIVMADRVSAKNNELCYVAVSRARALLLVVGPTKGTLLEDALLSGKCEVVAS